MEIVNGKKLGPQLQNGPWPINRSCCPFTQNSGLIYINMVRYDGNDAAGAVRLVGLFVDWMVANFLLGERSQERHRR